MFKFNLHQKANGTYISSKKLHLGNQRVQVSVITQGTVEVLKGPERKLILCYFSLAETVLGNPCPPAYADL